jgi:hypothetical protein
MWNRRDSVDKVFGEEQMGAHGGLRRVRVTTLDAGQN